MRVDITPHGIPCGIACRKRRAKVGTLNIVFISDVTLLFGSILRVDVFKIEDGSDDDIGDVGRALFDPLET
jgi:hypothetical protein